MDDTTCMAWNGCGGRAISDENTNKYNGIHGTIPLQQLRSYALRAALTLIDQRTLIRLHSAEGVLSSGRHFIPSTFERNNLFICTHGHGTNGDCYRTHELKRST